MLTSAFFLKFQNITNGFNISITSFSIRRHFVIAANLIFTWFSQLTKKNFERALENVYIFYTIVDIQFNSIQFKSFYCMVTRDVIKAPHKFLREFSMLILLANQNRGTCIRCCGVLLRSAWYSPKYRQAIKFHNTYALGILNTYHVI